jgi:hypothetical protein
LCLLRTRCETERAILITAYSRRANKSTDCYHMEIQ